MESKPVYGRANPFLARVKERRLLCKPGSDRQTYHVVLDLNDSGITYQVGDSIAVQPTNVPDVVEKTLHAMRATGTEMVHDRQSILFPLKEFLLRKVNLPNVTKKLIGLIAERQTDASKKAALEDLLKEDYKDQLKQFQSEHEVWDFLTEHLEVRLTPQELCSTLQPLLPRFYSIASSAQVVGDEVHLTIAALEYETNGQVRYGVCTHYLCHVAPHGESVVPVYIQPSNGFTLPEGDAHVIMIGPGTGVAPFRGFMQERVHCDAKGKNWLFFGERHRQDNFLYEEDWTDLVQKGHLRLDTAFSRDQDNKIYVQHRLLEHGQEFFQWLEDGAYIFVCGDAQRMAKDVDYALHQIVQIHGQFDEQRAKEYVKKLKSEKRYLRDVY